MTIKCPLFLLILITAWTTTFARQASDQTFIVEGYYKAKWGYADEFIDLFKKNHYPLLKKHLKKEILFPSKQRSRACIQQRKQMGL